VKLNREGDLLFTASKGGVVCLWWAETGERIGTYTGHQGSVWQLDVNRNSTRLVTASGDQSVRFWDVETGKELCFIPHKVSVRCVAYSRDDKQILTVSDMIMGSTPTLFIFNVTDDPRAQSTNPVMEIPMPARVFLAVWGPLNETIICAGQDGFLRIYDPTTGEMLREVEAHTKQIMDIQFDQESITFITASKDGTAKLWDTKSLKLLKTYDTGRPINSAAVSPLKPHVILGGGQSAESVTMTRVDNAQFKVRFFHKVHQEELGSVQGHFGPVNIVRWSPDGKSFVSGAEDGYVRIQHMDPDYFAAFEDA